MPTEGPAFSQSRFLVSRAETPVGSWLVDHDPNGPLLGHKSTTPDDVKGGYKDNSKAVLSTWTNNIAADSSLPCRSEERLNGGGGVLPWHLIPAVEELSAKRNY